MRTPFPCPALEPGKKEKGKGKGEKKRRRILPAFNPHPPSEERKKGKKEG